MRTVLVQAQKISRGRSSNSSFNSAGISGIRMLVEGIRLRSRAKDLFEGFWQICQPLFSCKSLLPLINIKISAHREKHKSLCEKANNSRHRLHERMYFSHVMRYKFDDPRADPKPLAFARASFRGCLGPILTRADPRPIWVGCLIRISVLACLPIKISWHSCWLSTPRVSRDAMRWPAGLGNLFR